MINFLTIITNRIHVLEEGTVKQKTNKKTTRIQFSFFD
jgi:hypothetical protein